MKIAVTHQMGQVFQHFGHSEQFKFYEVTDGEITKIEIKNTDGKGHGALAGFLKENGVNVVICGGIGGGAQNALIEAGIEIFGGVKGSADAAVVALLSNNLVYDPEARCDHHDHEHGEGHVCGEHGCH